MTEHQRGLLDTSVVIDLPLISTGALPEELAITTVTLAELAAGPHANCDSEERAVRQQRLQWAEATFDPLPFDAEAVRSYGRVYAAVRSAGRQPRKRVSDLFITAIAVSNSLPLLTRNHDDFAGLEELVDLVPV